MASKKNQAKKKNAGSGVGFTIAVIIGLVVLAKGCEDPNVTPVPPSVPTDVGTLPPGLDK